MNIDRKKSFIGNSLSTNTNTIKGLQIFIADLRSSQYSQNHEGRINSELVKIKQHFEPLAASGQGITTRNYSNTNNNNGIKLDGYQRKKYVAKLAYIYITTNTGKLNDILFGIDQMLNLVSSTHFSEKFMGYMILELLFKHEKVSNLAGDRIIPKLLLDLSSNNDNFTGLALNFIGVVGELTSLFSNNDDIVNKVFQIIRSPTSPQYLKKKSALAFLALLKNNLSILTDDPQRKNVWVQKIIGLLDNTDNYRVTLTALPLVEYIARNINPSYCFRIIPQLTDILYTCIVLGTSDSGIYRFPTEYKFANIPNPWLITKIVSLLNVLIASPHEVRNGSESSSSVQRQCLHATDLDPETLNKLRKCSLEAISLGSKTCSDPMERIVRNTILFSLIKFATKLDPSDEAIANSVHALCSLLNSPEINIKYLTLDSLTQLCATNGNVAIDAIRAQNLDLIIHLMNTERDMSILGKIVNLLYTFADIDNVQTIVDHLLNFFLNSKHISGLQIRSNISVKIAVLTEQYATDPNWYVDISLKILSLTTTSSFNDDELWYRLCQIIVNNPQLRDITCHNLLNYLVKKQTSEYIVKTSAFLLGEYPSLVMDKISIENLFTVFAEKYFTVSNLTRAMILTTMLNFYKFAPQLGSNVIKIFQLELNSLDTELQTRSYEYLKIIQISKMSGDMNLLNILLAPMPPFNTKSNPLLKRLGTLQEDNSGISQLKNSLAGSATLSNVSAENRDPSGTVRVKSRQPPLTPAPRRNTNVLISVAEDHNIEREVVNPKYLQHQLASTWREGFSRMLLHKQGIFYSSPLIKILYRTIHLQPYHLKLSLTYINQTEWDIVALSTEFIAAHIQNNPEYVIQNMESISNSSIPPHKRVEQSFQVVIRKPFGLEESPLINLYFKCGASSNNIILKLGVGMTSTLNELSSNANQNSSVTLPQFISRWKTLGEALGKDAECHMGDILVKHVTGNQERMNDSTETLLTSLQTKLKKSGLDIIEQNNVPNTLFVAGIIHTKTDGNFGCLLKLQCKPMWKVNITCKTTIAGPLAAYIVECLKSMISD